MAPSPRPAPVSALSSCRAVSADTIRPFSSAGASPPSTVCTAADQGQHHPHRRHVVLARAQHQIQQHVQHLLLPRSGVGRVLGQRVDVAGQRARAAPRSPAHLPTTPSPASPSPDSACRNTPRRAAPERLPRPVPHVAPGQLPQHLSASCPGVVIVPLPARAATQPSSTASISARSAASASGATCSSRHHRCPTVSSPRLDRGQRPRQPGQQSRLGDQVLGPAPGAGQPDRRPPAPPTRSPAAGSPAAPPSAPGSSPRARPAPDPPTPAAPRRTRPRRAPGATNAAPIARSATCASPSAPWSQVDLRSERPATRWMRARTRSAGRRARARPAASVVISDQHRRHRPCVRSYVRSIGSRKTAGQNMTGQCAVAEPAPAVRGRATATRRVGAEHIAASLGRCSAPRGWPGAAQDSARAALAALPRGCSGGTSMRRAQGRPVHRVDRSPTHSRPAAPTTGSSTTSTRSHGRRVTCPGCEGPSVLRLRPAGAPRTGGHLTSATPRR